MRISIAIIGVLSVFSFRAGAQNTGIHLQKIHIKNSADSRLYQSVALPRGWVAVGRSVDTAGNSAAGLVYVHSNEDGDTVVLTAPGQNCRLYTVLADSDTTFIAAGYIGSGADDGTCAFFARFHHSGRLMDSARHCLGGGPRDIVTRLQKDAAGRVYAWGKSGTAENSQPRLLQLTPALALQSSRVIDINARAGTVTGELLYLPGEDRFAFADNDDTGTILGKVDKDGRLLYTQKIKSPTGYHNAVTANPDYNALMAEIEPFQLHEHSGHIYLTGTVDQNFWVGKFDTAFQLLQSHQVPHAFVGDEAGRLYFTRRGAWLSVVSTPPGDRQGVHKLVLFNDTLGIEEVQHTELTASLLHGFPAGEAEIVATGFVKEEGGAIQPAFARLTLPAARNRPVTMDWKSLEGPPGADATAFAIDTKGNYWLGTGSSGGVYFSGDKGRNWAPVLKGLGAMHITALFYHQDTLWATVDDMRLEEILGKEHASPAYFYLTGKKRKWQWKWYADRARSKFIERAINNQNILLFNRYQEHYPLQRTTNTYSRLIQYYKGFGVDLKNESFDLYRHEVSNRMSGFYEVDSATRALNTGFPPDVFDLRRNIDMDGNRLVLLSKSGLYFSDDRKTLYNAPRAGLLATDVRLVRERKNKDLIALVGTQEIWRYRDEQWTMLFSTNDHYKKAGKDSIDIGLDIPAFDIGANDEVVFSFGADIWKIGSNDSASLVLPHGNHFNTKNGNTNLFGGTALADGSYLLTGVSEKGNDFEVYHLRQGQLHRLKEMHPGFSFPYTDKAGNAWIVGDSVYRWQAASSTLTATLPRVGIHFNSAIASNRKGQVAILSGNSFLVWQPTRQLWLPYTAEAEPAKNNNYGGPYVAFTSIAISDEGQVYFGAGPTYSVMCGFSIDGYPDGVFAFDGYRLRSLFNPINNWIYALEAVEGGRLIVGTSGSGVVEAKR